VLCGYVMGRLRFDVSVGMWRRALEELKMYVSWIAQRAWRRDPAAGLGLSVIDDWWQKRRCLIVMYSRRSSTCA
jgi:hypothetical protein